MTSDKFPITEEEAKERAKKELAAICFVQGFDADGEAIWAYVGVPLEHFEAFAVAQASGDMFNPSDYGDIIVYGPGHEAPDEVKQRLKDEYGYDHDNEAILPNVQHYLEE